MPPTRDGGNRAEELKMRVASVAVERYRALPRRQDVSSWTSSKTSRRRSRALDRLTL